MLVDGDTRTSKDFFPIWGRGRNKSFPIPKFVLSLFKNLIVWEEITYKLRYSWICGSIFIQGVLILQDQYRALIQYSFTKDSDGQYDKMPTDWYCNCGVFNFKRRDNCFKCSASREESEKGGEGSDEISNILTKSKSLNEVLRSY